MTNFTLVVALNAIKKLFAEKWKLSMFLLIPLMMGGLFSLISGSDGQPKPSGILIVTDNDKSTLSKLIVMGFSQGPMAEMFKINFLDSNDAKVLMEAGDASVWLEIEKNFSRNFLDNKPTTLKLVKNPSLNILPEIAEKSVNLLADTGHYVHAVFSKELKGFSELLSGKNLSDAQMASMSIQIKHTIDSIEKQLFPPQINPVQQLKEKQEQASASFLMLMFPGILFMSLLFASQSMALEFWHDKTQGVSRRLLSSPSGLTQYFNGKLIASIFVYALIALVIGVLGVFLFEIPYHKLIVIIGWLMLSGLVLGLMMLFVSFIMPTEKSANVVTSAMVFPLMMLGGSFFPFDAMPKIMATVGQFLPNGYLLHHFSNWLLKGYSLTSLVTPLIIALAFISVMWVINKSILPKFVRV